MHSDVLIVGAGSAGSVLAERLSADSSCHVTVVEAGPEISDRATKELIAWGSQLPIGIESPVAAHYPATLTQHPHRPVRLVRGSVIGGSGAINGGYFCRGRPSDFDRWNVPLWSWPEVLEHFRAIESDHDFSSAFHGDAGPIPVRRTDELSKNAQRFADAALVRGYPWIPDMNADVVADPGVGAVPLNILNGVRSGPGVCYLAPAMGRPNLTVRTATRASRIRIESGRAIGVESTGAEGDQLLTADRIVLSAGAIGSAHLLMLSGIGDETVLRRVGIPVVACLPVGLNTADHPEWVLPADWSTDVTRPVLEVVFSIDDMEIRPYVGGFLAMMGDHAAGHAMWPHIGVALMQPLSRGRVTVRSADPRVAPVIEHRYDSEPVDVSALREGTDLVREVFADLTRDGEPKWSTSQHLCGTAPMGADNDEQAVLDPTCRVRGIEGLWVVDGSIMPAITSRGPHATIAMIGHRAAEFIRAR